MAMQIKNDRFLVYVKSSHFQRQLVNVLATHFSIAQEERHFIHQQMLILSFEKGTMFFIGLWYAIK